MCDLDSQFHWRCFTAPLFSLVGGLSVWRQAGRQTWRVLETVIENALPCTVIVSLTRQMSALCVAAQSTSRGCLAGLADKASPFLIESPFTLLCSLSFCPSRSKVQCSTSLFFFDFSEKTMCVVAAVLCLLLLLLFVFCSGLAADDVPKPSSSLIKTELLLTATERNWKKASRTSSDLNRNAITIASEDLTNSMVDKHSRRSIRLAAQLPPVFISCKDYQKNWRARGQRNCKQLSKLAKSQQSEKVHRIGGGGGGGTLPSKRSHQFNLGTIAPLSSTTVILFSQ